MYSFATIARSGLVAGEAETSGLRGVFCYSDELPKKAIAASSSSYSVYSSIAGDGFFWTVKYELLVAYFMRHDPAVGRMTTKKGNQWACKPGTFHLIGIWLHAIHQEDMHLVKHFAHLDPWHPEYEVPWQQQ